ncbi:MAG: flagellar biosynthesis anti-sigma factor FlgM [Acidobacteriaceae bacterium]|nr:flagellar biosynthesis anti-sigma factor FlgM [Acidobacteriaceae bacterium]
MKAANLVGMNTEVRLSTPDEATDEMPAFPRPESSEVVVLETRQKSCGAHEIARDSAQLKLAGTLISQASKGSDVRFEKVASLRQAIKAGKFHVSAGEVAEKLVDDMQTMKFGNL